MISGDPFLYCSMILQHKILTNCIRWTFFFQIFFARLVWGKRENHKITLSQVTLYEDPDFSFSLWCSETSSVVYWRSLILPVLEKQRLLDERVGGHGANILPCKALSSFCLGGTATMSKDVPWVGALACPCDVNLEVHPGKFSELLNMLANSFKVFKL